MMFDKDIVTFICVHIVTCQLSQKSHKCRPIACVFEFVYCTKNSEFWYFSASNTHSHGHSFKCHILKQNSISRWSLQIQRSSNPP